MRLDEATHNIEAAIRKREAAEAALQLAITGASPEERALAAAQVKQAEAALSEREVDVAELKINAPTTGQITTASPRLARTSAPARRCSR